jgi:long-subunit fatty acid transport protein
LVFAWTLFPNLGDERAGTAAMQFLKLGAGARAAAMGNSVASASEDAFGLYWNPAALVWGERRQLALSHNIWVVDLSYDFIGYTMKLNDDRAIGASIIYLGSPDMDVTDEYHPYGTGEKFGFADFAVGASFSQRLTDYFSFGGTVKFAEESLENLKMKGLLLDLGTYYQTNFHATRFSVTLSNFGQQVKPGGSYIYTNPAGEKIPKPYQSFSPPAVFRIAVATDMLNNGRGRWQATAQLDHPTDNAESFSLGTEYGMGRNIFFRGGYKLNNDTQSYSLGIGLKFRMLATDAGFDYAFSSIGDLGNSNIFSFQWSF